MHQNVPELLVNTNSETANQMAAAQSGVLEFQVYIRKKK